MGRAKPNRTTVCFTLDLEGSVLGEGCEVVVGYVAKGDSATSQTESVCHEGIIAPLLQSSHRLLRPIILRAAVSGTSGPLGQTERAPASAYVYDASLYEEFRATLSEPWTRLGHGFDGRHVLSEPERPQNLNCQILLERLQNWMTRWPSWVSATIS